MGESLASMGPAVANHIWQSTAFAVVAAGLALALKKNHARARYWVWMAASVKFVVPFAVLIGLGGMLPRPQHAVVTMPVYSAVDEVGLPFDEMELAPVAVVDPTLATMKPSRRWGTQLRAALTWPVVLAGIWVGGVVVVLGIWCGGWLKVMRTLRQSVRAESGREVEALRRVERRAGMRRGMELRLVFPGSSLREAQDRTLRLRSGQASGTQLGMMEPGIFGVWRPVLIWPEGLSERLNDEQVEAILAHELAHARRRDNLTAALHMLVEAAFWFDPVVWWLGARLVAERERACDEAVVEMGSRPGVYAESLLKAVRFCVESPLVCVAGVTGADLKQRVRAIMTARMRRLGVMGKLALAGFALVAIAGPVAFGVVRMIPMFGQIPDTAGPLPAFEVATIKPSDPDRRGKGFTMNGRHFSTLNTTASDLLQYAYGVQARQIVDAPAWMDVDEYDIAAVASEGDADPKWKLMVRKLLTDRFGLTFHNDTRDLPVYELRVGKNGPKLAKSGADVDQSELYFSRTSKSSAGTTLHAKAATMAGLASLLQVGPLGRPVVDRTGLTGTFDFTMDFTADTAKGGDAAAASEDMNAPAGIFTAIQEQLGLKLVAGKGPAEVMVIDRIEKPAPDNAATTAAKALEVAAKEVRQILEPQGVSPPDSFRARLLPVGQERTGTNPTRDDGAVTNGAPGTPFKFDVVSIRPAEPEAGGRRRLVGFQFTDDGFVATNQSLTMTLLFQYQPELQLDSNRIVGGPDWVRTLRWDIHAKVADSDVAEWSNLAHDASAVAKERRRATVEGLLAERFKLKTHFETREGTVYDLVVAKGGSKLKPSTSDEPPRMDMGRGGPGHLSVERATVGAMVPFFAQELGHPVIDETGITGQYDMTLEWSPTQGAGGGDAGQAGTSSDTAAPSLFTAVQEQLGLKLEAQKGPIETLVIDGAEKPSVDGAEVQAPGADTSQGRPTAEPGAPRDLKQQLHGVYKVWLDQDVRWVITDKEAEAFRRLTSDQERDEFIENFWQLRNPNPGEADNTYRDEMYARIAYANEHFADDGPGWMSDRGHVYIVYGKPDEVDVPVGGGTETWRYRHLAGVGDNVVLKFGFVVGLGRYRLVGPLPAGLFGAGATSQGRPAVEPGAPGVGAEKPNPLKRRLTDAAFVGGVQGAGDTSQGRPAVEPGAPGR